MDSSGLLQDSAPPAGRFRPYASTAHRVTRGRYITSNDPRGYIPVYEYPLNGQWIMMDIDDGYILWTGIWKALGNAKADIVKMLESQPDLAHQLRRVRGGYLKIQGTWMPYEVALRLARRVAWPIREDLIPLFGPTFPTTCLSPEQPGYGQILGAQHGKRRGRRAALPLPMPVTLPPPHTSEFATSSGSTGQQTQQIGLAGPSSLSVLSAAATRERNIPQLLSPHQVAVSSGTQRREFEDNQHAVTSLNNLVRYHYPLETVPSGLVQAQPPVSNSYASSPLPTPPTASSFIHNSSSNEQQLLAPFPVPGISRDSNRRSSGNAGSRYSPYESAVTSRRRAASSSMSLFTRASPIDLPPLAIPLSHTRQELGTETNSGPGDTLQRNHHAIATNSGSTSLSTSASTSASLRTSLGEAIVLPPIRAPAIFASSPQDIRHRSGSIRSIESGSGYSLPPISSMDEPPLTLSSDGSPRQLDSTSILKRLTLDDEMVGRARGGSLTQLLGRHGSHRDEEARAHMSPTHEQLWTRRRSLSAPPLNPDCFPKSQHSWSAAPNVDLFSSSYPRPPSARLNSSVSFAQLPMVFDSKRIFQDRGRESSLQVANQSPNNATEYYSGRQDMAQIDTKTTSIHDADSESSRHRSPVNDDTDRMRSRDRVADSRINRAFQPTSSSGDVWRAAGESKHPSSEVRIPSSQILQEDDGNHTPRQFALHFQPRYSPRSRSQTPARFRSSSVTLPDPPIQGPTYSCEQSHVNVDLTSYRFGGES